MQRIQGVFAVKGNTFDLAVGVVLGAAFGGIITSLVNDVLATSSAMSILLTSSGPWAPKEYPSLEWPRGSAATLNYGNFIQSIVSFLLIAIALFPLKENSPRRLYSRTWRPIIAPSVAQERNLRAHSPEKASTKASSSRPSPTRRKIGRMSLPIVPRNDCPK